MSAVQRTMTAGFVSGVGPAIDEFETKLAEQLDVPHVVVCSSGTAALHLALLAVGITPGDEVIVPSFTFAATANAAKYCGAKVTLIDSSPTDWNLDSQLLHDVVAERAARGERLPAAIIAVDIIGMPVQREPLEEIQARFGIPIVEDAAEALGATWSDGRRAGAFGTIGALSFNGNKLITSGNGGAVVAADPRVAERVRYLANQAKRPGVGYQHDEVGFNYRMSSINAALGNSQLARLPQLLAHKKSVFDRYLAALTPLGFQTRPPFPDRDPSHWLASFLLPATTACDSDSFVLQLAARGVEARPLWTPLHQMRAFADCERIGGAVADGLRIRGVSLPCSEDLTDSDCDEVVAAITGVVADLAAES